MGWGVLGGGEWGSSFIVGFVGGGVGGFLGAHGYEMGARLAI